MSLNQPRQRLLPTHRASAASAAVESAGLPRPCRQSGGPSAATARGRRLMLAPALLCGGLGLTALPVAAVAGDPSADDLNKLRTEIQKEIVALKKQEAKLHQQFLELDRKSQLLDRKNALLDEQLRTMRATGAGSANPAPPGVGAPGSAATISSSPAQSSPTPSSGIEVAQAPAPPAPSTGGQAAP